LKRVFFLVVVVVVVVCKGVLLMNIVYQKKLNQMKMLNTISYVRVKT